MNLKDKLKTLPNKPGCYLMKDSSGNIIYVGKAINLKNRVNSYFIGAHDYKTTKLVHNIRDFDYIVVSNEKEALILEYNLIKQYKPKFNIVFKDDKSYPYIQLSNSKEPNIEVIHVNKKNKNKGKLFGPYPDVGAARKTVEIINRMLPLRKCHNLQNDTCLYYHMNQCLGYCIKNIDDKTTNDLKEKVTDILNGNVKEIISFYKKEMKNASDSLDYEKAKEYRDIIQDLNKSIQKVSVQKNNRESFCVFNYAIEDGYIDITGLFIEKGRLLNKINHIDYLIGDPENYVSNYIFSFFTINPSNKDLYIPYELFNYLDGNFIFKVKKVTRGQKYSLLKQAKENSIEHLRQNREIIVKKDAYNEGLHNEFKKIFNISINRIELFDNSHLAGKNTVAAMVVYKDFKPSKKDYRLYKLEEGADDLKSMKEVLYRRYFRVLSENLERPDLIIVDGGRNQIEVALEIIDSLNLGIKVVGLGKDNHHNTSYLMDSNFNKIDIPNDSNIFFFLTNCQDEVHRFAITYQKKLRRKNTYKSILDEIDGIGPKTRVKLLRKYKTIANIKTQSLDELKTVLNSKTAIKLYNRINVDKFK